jgi:dipeptidyl aminopeptidase/acylaminoacyl peptidase
MRTPRRLGRVSLVAILTMLAGLILAGPAHATFPGPNGQIAFADGTTGQLYTINPDGTGLRQLTHLSSPSYPTRPDWSPDGRRIVFADLGDARLYVIDRGGHRQHLVFAELAGYKDFFPKYAPDGDRLVFSRCQPGDSGSCAIFSVLTDGTHLHALTPFTHGAQLRADFGATVSPAAGSPSAGSPSALTRHRSTSSGPTAAAPTRSLPWRSGRSRPTGPPTVATCW